MNFFNETEKSLKRYLKSKVKITAATIVGFLIAGTVVFGADKVVNIDSNFDGANVIESVINGDIAGIIGNSGVEVGKVAGENLILDSVGANAESIGNLMESLAGIKPTDIQGSQKIEIPVTFKGQRKEWVGLPWNGEWVWKDFSQTINIPLYVPENIAIKLTGAKAVLKDKTIDEDVVVNIGEENKSPLVIGVVGGDLSTSIGAWELGVEEANESTSSSEVIIKIGEQTAIANIKNDKYKFFLNDSKYTVTRNGNIEIKANNGDILGLSTGSTALALGNMGIKKENLGIKLDLTGEIIPEEKLNEILNKILENAEGPLFNNAFVKLDKEYLDKEIARISELIKNSSVIANLKNIMDVDLQLAGNTETIVNGDTTLNIKDKATVIGATAGGTALGMGGKAVSTVTGNTTINIDSKDNLLNGDGITAGVFGGGVAVSTLGGSATTNSNVNNNTSTDITVNSGTTGMLVGGGLAASTDISNIEKIISLLPKEWQPTITEDGKIIVNLDGLLGQTLPSETGNEILDQILAQLKGIELNISGLKDGGTSISNVGDVNIALNGNTTAMGVIGGGIALANQNADSEKVSTSIVTGKDSKITINLDENTATEEAINKAVNSFVGALDQVFNPENIKENIDNPSLITTQFGKVVEDLKNINANMAVGVTGNGIAASFDKGQAEASMETTDITIDNGLVLGVMGNGIALANNNSQSTVTAESTNVTINGGNVYGVTGNGIAIYGDVNGGNGKAIVETTDSNIKVTDGKVEGIVAGGMAVSLNTSADRNAEANINGTSTIEVSGGTVNKIGDIIVKPIEDKLAGTDLANLKVLGDKAAIIGGGIAIGNASSNVEKSVINVVGGTINGDIIGGGVAVGTATVTTGESTITVGDATVNGDIIAGGVSLGGNLTVGKSTIELSGATVNGDIYGQGVGADLTTVIPMIKDSNLNIKSGENKVDAIYGFTDVTVEKGASLGVDDKIVVVAGNLENNGTITLDKEGTGNTLIDLYVGNVTNRGTIELGYGNVAVSNNLMGGKLGTVKNTGIIKLTGVTADDFKDAEYSDVVGSVFKGEYVHTGLIVDEAGKAIITEDMDVINDDISVNDIINSTEEKSNSVTMVGGSITGADKTVELDSLNITDKIYVFNDKEGNGLNVANTDINMDKDGVLSGLLGNMDFTDVNINKANGGTAIELNGSSLTLNGESTVNGDISGVLGIVSTNGITTINGNMDIFGLDLSGEKNIINGNVNSLMTNIDSKYTYLDGSMNFGLGNIGDLGLERAAEKSTIVETSANTSMSGAINVGNDSQIVINMDKDGNNLFGNSSNLTLVGKTESKDEVKFITSNLVGEKITIDLNGVNFVDMDAITDSKIFIVGNDGKLDGQTSIDIVYNNNLFGELDPVINYINAQMKGGIANSYFTGDQNLDLRAEEINRLYSSNIYAETIRAAYKNVKLSEERVLDLDRFAETKKWAATGVALTEKTEHKKDGRLNREYRSELDSTGLLADIEYGVSDDTAVGFVFSGTKQDIDTAGGNAKGDVFYLGAYTKKDLGKFNIAAGIGYQYGKYEADNTAALKATNASYDSNSYSAYVQGKYNINLEENVTVAPKAKLGYSYIDQEDTKDGYFRLTDGNLSTVDAEIGVDLVKSIVLEKGKLDITLGTSYVRNFGDTDKKFTGNFIEGGSFDVLGANLSEDSAKFDLGVEVSKDNGVFYNLGGTLRIGSDNTRDYGAKLGIGYKF